MGELEPIIFAFLFFITTLILAGMCCFCKKADFTELTKPINNNENEISCNSLNCEVTNINPTPALPSQMPNDMDTAEFPSVKISEISTNSENINEIPQKSVLIYPSE